MSGDIKCPVCGDQRSLHVAESRDYFVAKGKSAPFSVYVCEKCHNGFSFPLFNDSELAPFYPDSYEAYSSRTGFRQFLQTWKYRLDIRHLLKFRTRKKKEGLSLFEIGAGRAEFLWAATQEGLNVGGLEPGSEGCKFAKENFKIDLLQAYASELKFQKRFDVVAIRNVLEHINDPASCLKTIHDDGLRKDGTVFIKVPRLDSWEARVFGSFWSGLDLPRHRIHFSSSGIKYLLEKCGFSDVQISPEVVPTDLMRSMEYFVLAGEPGVLRTLASFFCRLPETVQILGCQVIATILRPFGTGRMIVSARLEGA